MRRPRLLASLALVAVAGVLVSVQPLRSEWWTGYDFDSVYAASALTLFRGEQSKFYDHPGVPLQETLGAAFTAGWLLGGAEGSRAERADAWLLDLDATRPYLRAFGVILFAGSALLVLLVVAALTGSALWGLVGGVLFLGAPSLIDWAAVTKPDPPLAALSVAVVALLVTAARRRSTPLYAAAAAVLGLALTVKLHAGGLALPFAAALLAWPPRAGGWEPVRAWARTRRRPLLVAAGTFAALALALNVIGPRPDARHTLQLAAGIVAIAVAGLAVRLVRPLRRWGELGFALAGAALAGAIVPNLLFASMPPTALRWAARSLTGGGVNVGAQPSAGLVETLRPWLAFAGIAAIGLVLALRRGDRTSVLWALAAAVMGGMAYSRYGQLHYYAPALALLVPLVVEALRPLLRRPILLPIVLFAVLYSPYTTGIRHAQERGREAERAERVSEWLLPRLGDGEVALTRFESSDSRHFYLVRLFAPGGAEPDYRLLPVEPNAAEYVHANALRVAYFATFGPEDVSSSLAAIGLTGRGTRVADAPGFVYRVSQQR